MEKRFKYKSYDSTNTYFWSICAPLILTIAVVAILSILAVILDVTTDVLNENLVVQIICMLTAQIAFLVYFFVYNKKQAINTIKAISLSKKVNIFAILCSIAIGAVLVFLSSPFVNLINYLLHLVGYNKPDDLLIPLNSFPMFLLGVFVFAIVPALIEELLFRGIVTNGLINSAKGKKAKYVAVILAALIFASIHLSLQQFIYPFVVGIVLGLILMITKNLVYTIIVHFSSNLIVVISNYVNYTGEAATVQSFNVGEAFFAVGMFILALGIVFGLLVLINYIVNKKTINFASEDEEQENEEASLNKEEKRLLSLAKERIKEKERLTTILAIVSAVVLIISDFVTYFKKG